MSLRSAPAQHPHLTPLQAVKRLHETLIWQAEERPSHLHCPACPKDAKSHYMQVVAFDRGRRPAIYSCLSIPTNHALEDNRLHMISIFEQAIAVMPPGVEDWVWVLDMHGFGLKNIDPRLAFAFLKVSAAHYPERLAQAYIISAPRVFHGFWKTIAPFIDPKTKSKIWFGAFHKHGDNAKVRAALAKNMDGPTVDWFMREMEENRHKSVAKHKHYWYPDLAALARDPGSPAVAQARDRRVGMSHTGAHDFLGTEAYLAEIAGRPERLPPSVFAVADATLPDKASHHPHFAKLHHRSPGSP